MARANLGTSGTASRPGRLVLAGRSPDKAPGLSPTVVWRPPQGKSLFRPPGARNYWRPPQGRNVWSRVR